MPLLAISLREMGRWGDGEMERKLGVIKPSVVGAE
jgi:hypothetical protein